MKKLLSLAFVIALALPALAEESPRYDFTVNVMPSRGGYLVSVNVLGPNRISFGTEMAAGEKQTFTRESADRTITCIVDLNSEGRALSLLEVRENGVVVAAVTKATDPKVPSRVAPPAPPAPPDPTWEGRHLRVGGDVKAPVLINRIEPMYTEDARAARVSGIVIVEARISETGAVEDVRVLKPLPFGLDQAAA